MKLDCWEQQECHPPRILLQFLGQTLEYRGEQQEEEEIECGEAADVAEQVLEVVGQLGEGEEVEKRILLPEFWWWGRPACSCCWRLGVNVGPDQKCSRSRREDEEGGDVPSGILWVGGV